MRVCVALLALVACVSAQGDGDLGAVNGLACPAAGYMFPDPDNLCFVWFCERGGEPPIKRACPKGVRVPSWWEGGTLNMCNIVNILKHGGEPTCLRCAANDVRPVDTCEDLENPCPAECTCETTEHTHRCDCPVELGVYADGFVVDMPVDHCDPNPCENGASCQNQWDGFFCFCPNGWTGHRCETSVCDWHPCLNGGTCVIDDIGYHCECPACWGGSCCNVTRPDCDAVTCPPCSTLNANGACDPVNEDYCGDGGVCNEETGECDDCDECYTGPTCKVLMDTCKCNKNCPLNSECEDLSDKLSHECVCHDCYGGQNCDQPIEDCDKCNPCPDDQVCSPNGDKVTCGCSSDCVTGPNCDQTVNSCDCNNPCDASSTCVDAESGPICECSSCKTGVYCEDDVQSCECVNPCHEGQQCSQNENGGFDCGCSDDCYTGQNCDELINTCECASPCDPAQVCSLVGGELTCSCADSCRTGEKCDISIDSCECNNPCVSGTCSDSDNGPVCACNDCYSGTYCDQSVTSCACANPCEEGEMCSDDGTGKLSCGCEDSCKTGPGCANTINTCECASPCDPAQVCSLVGGELTCSCADSCRTGEKCDISIDSCECNNPCVSGTCSDSDNGPVCACNDCYSGEYCDQSVTSCACANPCEEGEMCSDDGTGKLSCGCEDSCKIGSGCQDTVNTCECNNPCTDNQVCSMGDDGPVCSCSNPCQTGDNCETEIYSCGCSNPCEHGGRCEDGENGIMCMDCEDCWGGEFCKDRIDDCDKCNPCTAESQECYLDDLVAKCECKECVGGENCDTPLNTCACSNPCTADQEICLDGDNGPVCEIGNPSAGNAFTIVFEENHTEKSLKQVPLEIYLTPSVPDSGSRSVNIKSAGLDEDHHCYFDDTLTVPENGVLRYEVDRCMRHNKTGLDHVAIKITEVNNKAMIVYGINKDRWSADGFLATPDIQAGKMYQTASYSPAHRGTQFAVVGLRDNTQVELTLADDNDLPPPYNTKGSKYTFTLNAFETFQVQAICPVERGNKKSYCSKDLSGSIIKSDKVVHAFSGNIRAFVEAGEGLSRDHLVEQLIPTDRWGKYFGFVSVPERAVGDLLNIMALNGRPTKVDVYYDNEHEQHNLPVGGRLNKHVEIPSGKRVVIKSSEPLSVTQLTKSKDTYLYKNESFHDPVSITVPPVEQFTNNFFFSTPMFTGGKTFAPKPYEQTVAMIVAKKGEEQSITVDGKAISDYVLSWGDMPSVNGEDNLVGAAFVLPHGTSLIQNSAGRNFQCLIYGFDDRESYGLPAGMGFKKM